MKANKKNRILFSSGLLCTCVSVVIWNLHVSDGLQGFLLGLGFVLTIYGYITMKKNKPAC